MTRLLLALILAATCQGGTLSSYAAEPTRAVIANRSVPGRTAFDLPQDRSGIDGYIALLECDGHMGRVGDVVTVRWSGHAARLMIFDCAGDAATRAWMRRGNVIGEVDHDTALRWNSIGRGMKGARMCRDVSDNERMTR